VHPRGEAHTLNVDHGLSPQQIQQLGTYLQGLDAQKLLTLKEKYRSVLASSTFVVGENSFVGAIVDNQVVSFGPGDEYRVDADGHILPPAGQAAPAPKPTGTRLDDADVADDGYTAFAETAPSEKEKFGKVAENLYNDGKDANGKPMGGIYAPIETALAKAPVLQEAAITSFQDDQIATAQGTMLNDVAQSVAKNGKINALQENRVRFNMMAVPATAEDLGDSSPEYRKISALMKSDTKFAEKMNTFYASGGIDGGEARELQGMLQAHSGKLNQTDIQNNNQHLNDGKGAQSTGAKR